jgi:hypothetical protein
MSEPNDVKDIPYSIANDAIDECRRIVKEGLGINCTFVDDDARLIVILARRAITAGLGDDIDAATLKIIKEHIATAA